MELTCATKLIHYFENPSTYQHQYDTFSQQKHIQLFLKGLMSADKNTIIRIENPSYIDSSKACVGFNFEQDIVFHDKVET